jgi:hypothetical protein
MSKRLHEQKMIDHAPTIYDRKSKVSSRLKIGESSEREALQCCSAEVLSSRIK